MAEDTNLKFSVQIDRDTKRKKMKNWPKGGVAVVTWPTFHILRPANISGTAEDTNFKFCKHIDHNWY